MASPSLNFTKQRVPVARLFVLSILSISLLALDRRIEAVGQARNAMASLTFPLQWLAAKPVEFYRSTRDLAQSQTALQAQNRHLSAENIRLQAAANQNSALEQELNELKATLNLKQIGFGRSIPVEVVSSGRDPSSSLLVIDKGSESGIKQGDAVIDHNGLVGQVAQVRHLSADVRLMTADNLIVPVAVARTGMRSLVFGDGNNISLRYFPQDADLKTGDMLLTSGLDSIYPAGIPVAKVSQAIKATGGTFYRNTLEPVAGLRSSRYLLILPQQNHPSAPTSVQQPTPYE